MCYIHAWLFSSVLLNNIVFIIIIVIVLKYCNNHCYCYNHCYLYYCYCSLVNCSTPVWLLTTVLSGKVTANAFSSAPAKQQDNNMNICLSHFLNYSKFLSWIIIFFTFSSKFVSWFILLKLMVEREKEDQSKYVPKSISWTFLLSS